MVTITDRIDGVSGSAAIKAPCRAATTANITLSGLQTIDGIVLAVDDRVLVKNQTDEIDNGIYFVNTSSWSRSKDFDGNRDVVTGSLVLVNFGTVNEGRIYSVTTTDNPIVIDTSEITWGLAFDPASGGTTVPLPGTITRTAGLISEIALTGGSTYTIGRDGSDRIETVDDGTYLRTFTRNGSGQIVSWTIT
jgi:hypothetical protein